VEPKEYQQTFSTFVLDAKKIGADIGMCAWVFPVVVILVRFGVFTVMLLKIFKSFECYTLSLGKYSNTGL
jgi:hypothetical protein